jgi:broad specificity phosphatase PhoE
LQRWIAAYRVEPFGDEWGRTALQTLLILKALGANVDPQFREMFLPSYDPDREMTEDEIQAEMLKAAGARWTPKEEATQ